MRWSRRNMTAYCRRPSRPGDGSASGSGSGRQLEGKVRALADFPPRRDGASMPLDDALNDRQTHARPFKFPFSVQPLKNREQARRVRHIEARAIVANTVGHLALT